MSIRGGGVLVITNRLWPTRPSYQARYAMCHIVICGLHVSKFFFALHHKRQNFRKNKLLNTK